MHTSLLQDPHRLQAVTFMRRYSTLHLFTAAEGHIQIKLPSSNQPINQTCPCPRSDVFLQRKCTWSLKRLLDKTCPELMINGGECSGTFVAQSRHKTDVNHSPAEALNRHHLFQSLVTCVKGQTFLSHNRSQLIRTTAWRMMAWHSVIKSDDT